jgi:hypothetical protein
MYDAGVSSSRNSDSPALAPWSTRGLNWRLVCPVARMAPSDPLLSHNSDVPGVGPPR